MISSESFNFQEIECFRFGYNPIGKPFLFVNIYFVDGLLIDTGQSKAQKAILGTLERLDVKQIFITHHHEDHTGNILTLRDKFKCQVLASPRCCEVMKAPPPLSLAQKLVWGVRPSYSDLISTEEVLTTDNNRFSLIPIPGHAEDMVALYEPNMGWLFSADLYINSYIGYFLKSESIDQQITSLKKVLNIDFQTLFCSHNHPINDGKQKLDEKLDYLLNFRSKVIELYQQGNNTKQIFKLLKLKEHGFTYLISHGELLK
ncbi:MAG: MBL fold metallo-hydrolase [Bacteroidota bacterium]